MNQSDLERFMREALIEGRKALPECLPNPPVGCVIVRDGRIVARGFTQRPHRPHAEAAALQELSGDLSDCSVFVTLEPCSFHGRTPSCAEALVQRGAKQVLVAILDPDPRNSGRGISMLKTAGVEVTIGLLREDAHRDLDCYLQTQKAPNI